MTNTTQKKMMQEFYLVVLLTPPEPVTQEFNKNLRICRKLFQVCWYFSQARFCSRQLRSSNIGPNCMKIHVRLIKKKKKVSPLASFSLFQ